MWQKIKCWLGWHEWTLVHETVETKRLGYQQIFWYECKHCGKVKMIEELKIKIKRKFNGDELDV